MIDPASLSTGIGIAKTAYQALEFIRGISDSGIISAYFWHHGERIEGSEKIEVEIHYEKEDDKTVWWYSVKPLDDYVFIRVPLVESCANELVANVDGDPNPNAMYWRWIAPVLPGRIYGGNSPSPNLKVDFLVFGYKPKALIKYFQAK
jgi:hypothetical protein